MPAALCLVLGACAAGSAGPERRTTQPVAESNGQQPMTTTASASEDAPPAVALAPALEAPPGLFPVSQTGGLGAMGGGAVPGAPAGPTCPGPPARSTTFPFFEAGEAEGSVSVGTVTDGYLVNAATLPEPCPHCHVLPRQAARCLTHGSDELIGLLLRSAARLAREWPGTVLHLGNLSAAHGGDITWSMSHNSGRDADIAFPMTDPEGIPVEPPDMLYFDAHGWSFDLHGAYRIDLERTWAVIRTLLQDEQTTVQFVFIYRPLGQALLAHAHRKREPAKLIERAAEVMMQPGISLHNDHFHVRIHCSAQDVRLGCQELGPRREGAPDPLPLVRERIRQLQPLLASADAGQRYRAAHLLGVLGEPSAASAVIRLLRDGEPAVRWRSLRTLVELQTSTAVGAVVELLRGEQDPALLLAALEALERLGGPHAERGLIRLVTDPRELPLAEIADYSVGPGQRLAAAEEAADQPSPGGGGSVAAGAGGDVVARTGEEQESEVQLACVDEHGLALAGDAPPEEVLQPAPGPPGAAPLALAPPRRATRMVRAEAARALARATSPQAVPPLLALLADPDPRAAEAAHQALTRITNRDEGADPRAWQRWWTVNRRKSRPRWVSEGFRQAGLAVPGRPRRSDVPVLLAAVLAAPHLSYNARRLLATLLPDPPPGHLDWPPGAAALYWSRRHRAAR